MGEAGIVERLVGQLRARGLAGDVEGMARAILTRAGVLDEAGELTAKGRVRQGLGAAGRAIDRAAKRSGHAAADYRYSPRTNRATLRR